MSAGTRKLKANLKNSRWSFLFFTLQNLQIKISPGQFYGQTAEDAILQKLLPEKKGRYIDVGSGNPIKTSNTYVFYRRGWLGIAIDPLSSNRRLFRIFRPRDIFKQNVVSRNFGEMDFWEFRPYEYSTGDPKIAKKLIDEKTAALLGVFKVKSISLKDIDFDLSPDFPSLLCIDAEGFDFEVLQSNDWKRILPRVVCVEELNPQERDVEVLLQEHGYEKYAWTGTSSIYLYGRI